MTLGYFQFFTIIFAILILYEQIKLYLIDHKSWKRDLFIAVWSIHVLVFYGSIYISNRNIIDFHVFSPTFFSEWSAYLRFHSSLVFYFTAKSNRTFVSITQQTKNIIAKYAKESEIKNVD
jgi:hypothetical protein